MFLMLLVSLVLIVVFVVTAIAFITLYERHLLGGSQQRIGPNKTSFMGILQALFDGVKLLKKEQESSLKSSEISFLLVPGIAFGVMYLEWFVLPYFFDFVTFEFAVMFFLCLVGFAVYATLVSGIVSKSKYSMLGAIRASGQSVSYEIAFSLYLLVLVMYFNMFYFYSYFYVGLFWIYLPFLMMILAELGRAPFDFAEGESELVSGYNVEFGSVAFVLLFLGEYGSLLFFSVLGSVVFFGFSMFFAYVIFSLLVFIRSAYPRFRYDFMMGLFWFKMLPISLLFLLYSVILFL
uniref:NADH-ubiquinone oxidoreductase chain 1 n=1 Tax=Heterakis beramporia TaxID=596434 RepID=A0A142I169_9BILA|nr:NADH dehydrogenase subunit 1 [Heterakis beramporia]AMR36300.1 NADH dehydrogenase subunit 1 [Heterakis beramporia]